jgi:hypothetical protein
MAAKFDLSGTKWLIAAGALAGTIGGWALLAGNPGQTPTTTADSSVWNILNQPLPTLASAGVGGTGAIQGPPAAPGHTTLRSVNAPPPAPQPIVITRSSR